MKNTHFIVELIEVKHTNYEHDVVSVECLEIPKKHEKTYLADLMNFNDQYPLLLFKEDGIYSLNQFGQQVKL